MADSTQVLSDARDALQSQPLAQAVAGGPASDPDPALRDLLESLDKSLAVDHSAMQMYCCLHEISNMQPSDAQDATVFAQKVRAVCVRGLEGANAQMISARMSAQQ